MENSNGLPTSTALKTPWTRFRSIQRPTWMQRNRSENTRTMPTDIRNLLKAPPRTKQPPLLIFILVLIFPPRIPASEGSANCSLVCARSPHWYYTYFALHVLARTNIRTFSRFSALFHPEMGYIFFSRAVLCCFCWWCRCFLLLLLVDDGRRRWWALFSSSEQKNKKRSFVENDDDDEERDRATFSLTTFGSSPTALVMLHFATVRVLFTLHLNMMHFNNGSTAN